MLHFASHSRPVFMLCLNIHDLWILHFSSHSCLIFMLFLNFCRLQTLCTVSQIIFSYFILYNMYYKSNLKNTIVYYYGYISYSINRERSQTQKMDLFCVFEWEGDMSGEWVSNPKHSQKWPCFGLWRWGMHERRRTHSNPQNTSICFQVGRGDEAVTQNMVISDWVFGL